MSTDIRGHEALLHQPQHKTDQKSTEQSVTEPYPILSVDIVRQEAVVSDDVVVDEAFLVRKVVGGDGKGGGNGQRFPVDT